MVGRSTRSCNSRRPSRSIRVNPTQVASESSSKVARIERCMALLDPEDTRRPSTSPELRRFFRTQRSSGRLTSILHTGSPTIGEGARRSGGRSRDGGQVRGRVETSRLPQFQQIGLQWILHPPSPETRRKRSVYCGPQELTRERDSLRSRVPPTAPVDDPSNTFVVVPVIDEANSDLRRMQGRFTPY